jgi:hypothetical protein
LSFIALKYVMTYIVNTLAMIVCGAAGAALGWALAAVLDWTGVGGAIFAVLVAMTAATLLYAGGLAVGSLLRSRR